MTPGPIRPSVAPNLGEVGSAPRGEVKRATPDAPKVDPAVAKAKAEKTARVVKAATNPPIPKDAQGGALTALLNQTAPEVGDRPVQSPPMVAPTAGVDLRPQAANTIQPGKDTAAHLAPDVQSQAYLNFGKGIGLGTGFGFGPGETRPVPAPPVRNPRGPIYIGGVLINSTAILTTDPGGPGNATASWERGFLEGMSEAGRQNKPGVIDAIATEAKSRGYSETALRQWYVDHGRDLPASLKEPAATAGTREPARSNAQTPPPSSAEAQKQVSAKEQKNTDIQEELKGSERLQKLLGSDYDPKNGLSQDEIEGRIANLKTELKDVTDWSDADNMKKLKLQHGLQEVLDAADGREGGRELADLRASGKDLTTPEGRAEVEKAQDKIKKGRKVDELHSLRAQIAQDSELQKLLAKKGLADEKGVVDIIDATQLTNILKDLDAEYKHNRFGLSKDEKKLRNKLREITGVAEAKTAVEEIENIDWSNPEAAKMELKNAVMHLAKTHEADRNIFGKANEKVGDFFSKFGTEKLKQTRRDFVNYGRTLRQLKHEYAEAKAHDETKKMGNIEKSMAAARGLRWKALGEYAGKNIIKWIALLALLGVPLIAVVSAAAYAKGLQWLKKADQ